MRTPLYTENHGATLNGKPAVLVTGWYVDTRGKKSSAQRYLRRYPEESAIQTAKYQIAAELGAL